MDPSRPPRDHRHALFTQSFIDRMRKNRFNHVGCEILFNHFGDRGVIDVVLRRDNPNERSATWLMCEMKPKLYDVGEAIRQVRRAQAYFCQARPDICVKERENQYRFVLVLEAKESNLQQLIQYHDLFGDIEILFHHEDPAEIQRIQNLHKIQQAVAVMQRYAAG